MVEPSGGSPSPYPLGLFGRLRGVGEGGAQAALGEGVPVRALEFAGVDLALDGGPPLAESDADVDLAVDSPGLAAVEADEGVGLDGGGGHRSRLTGAVPVGGRSAADEPDGEVVEAVVIAHGGDGACEVAIQLGTALVTAVGGPVPLLVRRPRVAPRNAGEDVEEDEGRVVVPDVSEVEQDPRDLIGMGAGAHGEQFLAQMVDGRGEHAEVRVSGNPAGVRLRGGGEPGDVTVQLVVGDGHEGDRDAPTARNSTQVTTQVSTQVSTQEGADPPLTAAFRSLGTGVGR